MCFNLLFVCYSYGESILEDNIVNPDNESIIFNYTEGHEEERIMIIMDWNENDNAPQVRGVYFPDRKAGEVNFQLIWSGNRYLKNCEVIVSNGGKTLGFLSNSAECVFAIRESIYELFLSDYALLTDESQNSDLLYEEQNSSLPQSEKEQLKVISDKTNKEIQDLQQI